MSLQFEVLCKWDLWCRDQDGDETEMCETETTTLHLPMQLIWGGRQNHWILSNPLKDWSHQLSKYYC